MKVFPVNSLIKELDTDGLPVYDRPYESKDLRNVNKAFFTDGVFSKNSDELQVFPASSGGMNIEVHPGQCLIQGAFGIETEKRTLQLQAAEIDNDRIDTVVARLNLSVEHRNIDLYIVKGTPALSPKRPELTRNETVWELGLADIYLPRAVSSLSRARISDTRLETERCGFVAPFVQLQTTTFYDELQRQTDIAIQLAKDAIEETVAGKLQAAIDELNAKFPVAIENGGTGATDAATAALNLRQKPVQLWNGEWESGPITVPHTDEYNVFLAIVGPIVIPIYRRPPAPSTDPTVKVGDMIGTGSVNYPESTYVLAFSCRTSGNVWKDRVSRNIRVHPNYKMIETTTITSIWGVA